MEKPDIIQKINDLLKELFEEFIEKTQLEEGYAKHKGTLGTIAIFFAIIATPIFLIYTCGIIIGSSISTLTLCIAYLYRRSEDAKRISDDLENKNVQKKTGNIPIGKVIKIFMILLVLSLVLSLLYVDFHTYFVDPEITITSPRSGEVVKIDEENTYFKISGISKGLANNQFLHLFILYRRVDSNQVSGVWNLGGNLDLGFLNPCTVYNDGGWECRIQLMDLYKGWINETCIVKSPHDSSNNISTNVDIVAIIIKQSITHSVLTKLREGTYYDDLLTPDLYGYTMNYLPKLPKHLADDHVTITPLIESFNITGSSHGLLVCAYPNQIPADNETPAFVSVQVIDRAGNRLQSEGRIINLTCTRGNLSTPYTITQFHSYENIYITSGELGRGLILAHSTGLNNGTCPIIYTLPPVVVEFSQWINSSSGDGERSELTANFQTMHAAEYSVSLTGWGTEAHRPFKPEEWPIVRVEVDGIILGAIEVTGGSSKREAYGNVKLNAGNHTLEVNMTNSLVVPLVGDRNLYVERVEFQNATHSSGIVVIRKRSA